VSGWDASEEVRRHGRVRVEDAEPCRASAPRTVADELAELASRPPARQLATGWPGLDRLLSGGLYASQLAAVTGPTGAGKSGWGIGLARTIAETGTPVLYVSTELEADEVAARVAAQALGCRPAEILEHRVSPLEAAAAVAKLPISILCLDAYETADPIALIRARAEAIRDATGAMPVIVVDYLQQLAIEEPDRVRVTVGRRAWQLRMTAQALVTPIVGISSVSRAFYGASRKMAGEEDARAWLASAKESGDVEYHAAVVIYLDVGEPDANGSAPARAIVAKARRGRPGFAGMRFHGATGSWVEAEGALADMGPAKREGAVDRRVLEVVRSLRPARPRRELRALVPGCGVTAVDAAIVRLLAAGELEEHEETRPNSRGQMRTKKVIAARDRCAQ
jgi:replicative DNA helicase